jgi:hypothetical protein
MLIRPLDRRKSSITWHSSKNHIISQAPTTNTEPVNPVIVTVFDSALSDSGLLYSDKYDAVAWEPSSSSTEPESIRIPYAAYAAVDGPYVSFSIIVVNCGGHPSSLTIGFAHHSITSSVSEGFGFFKDSWYVCFESTLFIRLMLKKYV